jgi:ribose transport system ATP-binding protein/rhamnose transport system ATP-binding protein
MSNGKTILSMLGIEKSYGSVTALQGVDFSLREGEVMALLGENGAGKSTLVKLLAGLEKPDSGTVAIDGQQVRFRSPHQSLHAGIAYVTQELSTIGALSVAENICLGGDNKSPVWTTRKLRDRVKPYLEAVGLSGVDSTMPVDRLSVAQQQLVEIARLLSRNARILILDEPTAALSDAEIERVKAVVKALAREGRSIIYVTHRLGEVFELADRVTILRNGQSFEPVDVFHLDIDGLIERLLGRRLEQMFPPRGASPGQVVLEIKNLVAPGLTTPTSLRLRKGEILGLAGHLGSGANAIVRAVAGVRPQYGGTIHLNGDAFSPLSVRDAINKGIAYCSDDRKRDGIFAVRRIVENLSAPAINRVSVGGLISARRETELAGRLAAFFDINRGRLGSQADKLSGGNQQKVAIGKWLGIEPSILLVEEPTRGVDIGARAEIYRHLRTLANQGLAIMLASFDNQEILGLSDTIAAFFRGRLVRVAPADSVKPEALLRDITHPGTSSAGQAT